MSSPNGGTFWLPPQSSTVAGGVDHLFDFVLWLNYVFFALITILTIWFVIKYRRRTPDQQPLSQIDHNPKLELIWTVIPSIIIFGLFVWGFRVFLDLSTAPANAFEIRVTGEKWKWNFLYPDGTTTLNELHVPPGRPVKLVLTSKDVLHSFFVPEFRVKMDAVPNRYTTLWFTATSPGKKQVFCTEYCGTGHSDMMADAIVHPTDADFQAAWERGFSAGRGNLTPEQWGEQLYTKKTCNACHSTDGSPRVGPSFKGVAGKTEKLVDGSSALVDDNYLRESMMDPNAKIVAGFAPSMPSFMGQLKDDEVAALIAYIKSLK